MRRQPAGDPFQVDTRRRGGHAGTIGRARTVRGCGYCTSGMVVSAVALLRGNRAPTEREVRAALDGNLCRCGAHRRIVGAVMKAASEVAEQAR